MQTVITPEKSSSLICLSQKKGLNQNKFVINTPQSIEKKNKSPYLSRRKSSRKVVTISTQSKKRLNVFYRPFITLIQRKINQCQHSDVPKVCKGVSAQNAISGKYEQLGQLKDKTMGLLKLITDHVRMKQQIQNIKSQLLQRIKFCKKGKFQTNPAFMKQRMAFIQMKRNFQLQFYQGQRDLYIGVDCCKNIKRSLKKTITGIQKLKEEENQSIAILKGKFQEHHKRMQKLAQRSSILESLKQEINKMQTIHKQHSFHVSILKLQISPYFRVGFRDTVEGIDKEMALRKDVRYWDHHKCKKLQIVDVDYFVIIQLYKNWKKILSRLSYQYEGWGVILGIQHDAQILQDLQSFVITRHDDRQSLRKSRPIISFGSTESTYYQTQKAQLLRRLEGFDNGLLRILSLEVRTLNAVDSEQLEIRFMLMDCEQRSKIFELHKIQSINRESVIKLVSKGEKISCLSLEIPRLNTLQDHAKFEEVYDLLRKEK